MDVEIRAEDLRTVAALVEKNPRVITEGGLRWAIFNADYNGLAPALIRVGRRVFIHEPRFNRWLASSPKLGGRVAAKATRGANAQT